MNTRQKQLVIKLVIIGFLTIAFIIGMTWYKDIVIKKEAIRAMNLISHDIANYRITTGNLPPKSYIDKIIENRNIVRGGDIQYRARWLDFDSSVDTILAYTRLHHHHMLAKPGTVVLYLEDVDEMEKLIEIEQQIKSLQNSLKDTPSDENEKQLAKLKQRRDELLAAGKDGTCEWLPMTVFDRLFEKQQKELEAELLIRQQENQ